MATTSHKTLRNLTIGLLLGMALGLWFGMNLSRGRSLFSNPFAKQTLGERLKDTGSLVLDKSGQALEEGGKALRQAGH